MCQLFEEVFLCCLASPCCSLKRIALLTSALLFRFHTQSRPIHTQLVRVRIHDIKPRYLTPRLLDLWHCFSCICCNRRRYLFSFCCN